MSGGTTLVKGIHSFGFALTIGLSTSATAFAADLEALHDNDDLIKKWKCVSCHGLSRRIVGPSFLEIARSYTLRDVSRIIKATHEGSKNAWGTVPMPPTPNVPEADARSIAEWILALDNKVAAAGAEITSTSNVADTSDQTPSSSLPAQPQPFVTISPDSSRSFQS